MSRVGGTTSLEQSQISPEHEPLPSFRIGPWRVYPALNRLTRKVEVVQVEPRLMRVLECLARQPGEVITRNRLLQDVWGDVIVGEEALTVSISQLRRILGDDARTPHFIETIRKGGYRLVASVIAEDTELIAAEPERRPRRTTAPAVVTVLVLAAVMALGWYLISGRSPRAAGDPGVPLLHGRPLTSTTGSERYPAISPNGTQVVYSWQGDLYLTQPGAEAPLRLTEHTETETFPAWSPDGTSIAFARGGEEIGVYTISAFGGSARRLAVVDPLINGIDWSPDGHRLVLSTGTEPQLPYLIALLEVATGEMQCITEPQPEFSCDSWPRFSPDGTWVAFVRSGYGQQQDIFVVPADGGEERRVTRFQRRIRGLDWADPNHVIFVAAPSGSFSLWRVAVSSGELTWLASTGGTPAFPSISADGSTMVYEEIVRDRDIWKLPLVSGDGDKQEARLLIGSTRLDLDADISPDGETIVFISTRDGNHNLWACRRDGSGLRRLTDMEGIYLSGPRWSPDGTSLAFTASPDGYSAVHVLSLDGSAPRRLGTAGEHEIFSCWSEDGAWLYLRRDLGDAWEIRRRRPDGGDAAMIKSSRGSHALMESGGFLYCLRDRDGTLLRLSLGDSAQVQVLGPDVTDHMGSIDVVSEGIYGFQAADGTVRMVFFDFASSVMRVMAPGPVRPGLNLCIDPERRYVLYDRPERDESDLILVDLPTTSGTVR